MSSKLYLAAMLAPILALGGQMQHGDDSATSRPTKKTMVFRNASEVTRSEGKIEILSPVHTVDQVYKSMKGPMSMDAVTVLEGGPSQLAWLTGYRGEMVAADGEEPMAPQYFCHSNVDIRPGGHNRIFGGSNANPRVFTLTQGGLDIEFPEGFGVPVMTDEPLITNSQILNLNPAEAPFDVRSRVEIDYVLDRDLERPYRALYQTTAYVMVSLEGRNLMYNVGEMGADCESCCIPGKDASGVVYTDKYNRKYSGHWVVEPGCHENRTLVTDLLHIPHDTTIHFIAVHLHSFAESIELHDLTADKLLFKSHATNYLDRVGLERLEYFSSAEGVPVYADHDYELVCNYQNTTDENQDSMASLFIYMEDKEFSTNR